MEKIEDKLASYQFLTNFIPGASAMPPLRGVALIILTPQPRDFSEVNFNFY